MNVNSISEVSVFGVLLGLCVSSCIDVADPIQTSEIEQGLTVSTNKVWSAASIPVCWEGSTFASQKATVRAAVEESWELETGVTFVGWGTCVSSSAPGLHVYEGTIFGGSTTTSGFGNDLDGVWEGVKLGLANKTQTQLVSDAIFVFGLALGFTDSPTNGVLSMQTIADAGRVYGGPRPVSMIKQGTSRFDTFYRGRDNSLQHRWYDGANWHSQPLGGTITSDPSAVSWGSGRIDVFARGASGELEQITTINDGSPTWTSRGGVLIGAPTAVSWGTNRIDVFVRDTSSHVQWTWFDGTWHGYTSVSGPTVTSTLAGISWSTNRLDVFARGTDATLAHWVCSGTCTSATNFAFENKGGVIRSSPTVSSWSANEVDIFARTTSNLVTHLQWNSGYSGFETISLPIAGAPTATNWGVTRLDVFARDMTTMKIAHAWKDNSGPWWPETLSDVNGALKAGPGVVNYGPGHLEVIYRGTDAVWRKPFISSWQPMQLGNPISVSSWVSSAALSLFPQSAMQTSYSNNLDTSIVINVDPYKTFQTMTGFGAALTDTSAWVLNDLQTHNPQAASTLMDQLFGSTGIGISYLRIPLGSTDMIHVVNGEFSYWDLDLGRNFSITPNTPNYTPLLPWLQGALLRNSSLRFMGTPWSPPAWMKTNGNMIGGNLDPSHYNDYANYLVNTIDAYAANGIPLHALSVQNEPLHLPSDCPGALLKPTTADCGSDSTCAAEEGIVRSLGARMGSRTTRLLTYEHNWGVLDGTFYPQKTLDPNNGFSQLYAGVSFHTYATPYDPSLLSQFHGAFPTKAIYSTEASQLVSYNVPNGRDINLIGGPNGVGIVTVFIDQARNWSKTNLMWNLATDQDGSPHSGGCGGCEGVVSVHQPFDPMFAPYTLNPGFDGIGHFSKFVPPGSWRVDSNELGGSTNVKSVAFETPSCQVVLVVLNRNCAAGDLCSQNIVVNVAAPPDAPGGPSFQINLGGRSVTTFTWQGEPGCIATNDPL